MAKVSQRFWSFIVLGSALVGLGAGCGRNDVPIYGGVGVAGDSEPGGGFGNRARSGVGNSGGSGNVGNFGGRGNVGNFGGFGAIGNFGGFGNTGGIAGSCGDGFCAPGETMNNCLVDCHPLCHNGKCDLPYDRAVCPEDCASCGNNYCDAALDQLNGCAFECACGNGRCDAEANETAVSCPADCSPCNNDGFCSLL